MAVDEARQDTVGRRRAILAGSAGSLALIAAGLWFGRSDLAGALIDRKLAAVGVTGRYRIATLGPALQVIEDVRIGNPAHPDLVARRIALSWRYRLGLPSLAAVRIDGGRLHARWRDGQLSLGAVDRLLPRSGKSGAALPDLAVTLRDTRIALATPAGLIGLAIEGSGNAARAFGGTMRIEAPTLAIADCTISDARARLAVRIEDHVPALRGPVAVAHSACRSPALALGSGGAAIDLRLAPTLDRADGRVALAGFAGSAGPAAFGPISGTIGVAAHGTAPVAITVRGLSAPGIAARSASLDGHYGYASQGLTFQGRIGARGLAAEQALAGRIAAAATATRATPLGPIAGTVTAAVARLAGASDLVAPVALATGARSSLLIDSATIRARDGATATLSARIVGEMARWQAEADLAGAGLPHLAVQAARNGASAPIEATLRMAPYRAGAAMLALTPVRLTADRGELRFVTTATLDGPLGAGSIEGLTVPLAGTITHDGGVTISHGCATIGFRRVRLAGTTLDPARMVLCGTPIVRTSSSAGLRIAATARAIVLTGRSGAAPLALRAAALRIGETGFAAEGLAVRIGADEDPTRLEIGAIEGTTQGELRGTFAGAAGAIGHVPLALSGATGTWGFTGGALHLRGMLQVADRAAAPRFLPLVTHDVALDLAGGRIDAGGTLRSPGHDTTIARVTLHHDLASGRGGALLDVPGIAFARGGLQPEMLTPLTLGVIANVAGTVHGTGRIDWSAAGLTSGGTFATDRLDLAAAFGPVTGIAGTIRFTDLLGLVTAPRQEAHIAEINPGVPVADGVAQYQLVGGNRVQIEGARWPFAGGTFTLDPATLDFGQTAERRLTFRVRGLDAAAFIQQLDFPNISATGTFDGRLPMIFDQSGGRIEDGALAARGPGTLAYVGELSNAQLGTMGKLAFDALKAIRYSELDIALGGSLDGEIVTRVRFDGVRQATGDRGLVARMIRNLPFRFNIRIRAPFRGLVGSARSYANPALLLQSARPTAPVQPADSVPVRGKAPA